MDCIRNNRVASPLRVSRRNTYAVVFAKMIGLVFLCETIIMAVFHLLGITGLVAVVLDSLLLALSVTMFGLATRISPYRSALKERANAILGERRATQTIHQFFDEANSIIVRADGQGRILFANEYALAFFGFSKEELLGRSVLDTIVPVVDSNGRSLSPMVEAVCANPAQYRSNENECVCRDGRRVWVLWDNTPINDETGHCEEFLSIGHDVTRLKESELRTAESERKFRMLFEAAHDGILTTDLSSGFPLIVDANPACAEMFGYTLSEFAGLSPVDLTSKVEEGIEERVRAITVDLLAGRPQLFEWSCQRKDGSLFDAEVYLVAIELQEKPMVQVVIRDITEQRRLEAQKEEARRAAEAANRAKSEFLANMSHEIRTPLTAILGYAELMVEKSPRGENSSESAGILRNGRHLLEIINNILDLSKIEADRLEFELSEVNPKEVIGEVVALLKAEAATKGIDLTMASGAALPDRVWTAPLRLKQILINLVGNAVKFTKAGEVTIGGRRSDVPGSFAIEISDTGIGMSKEQLDRLFEPFVQADGSMTRRFGGTGLGLAISRKLARLLGGDIRVESQPDDGSCFTLILPRGPVGVGSFPEGTSQATLAVPADSGTARGEPLSGRRILVAEDSPDNRRIISAILRKAGATVTLVENGQEAVEIAGSQAFDLIVMDIQMPVLDGYEATRRLRQAGYVGPIVALTAHASDSDQQKCLAAGCDGYATKPFSRQTLLETLLRHSRAKPVFKA